LVNYQDSLKLLAPDVTDAPNLIPGVRLSVRPFVRPFVSWHGRRVAATSIRRDGGDCGGRCCRACLSVRPSVPFKLHQRHRRTDNMSVRPCLRWRL